MVITLILVVGVALAVLFMAYAARGVSPEIRSPEELEALTRSIDIEAFRNLVSSEEEEYLHRNLSDSDFRRVHRARQLAAIEYLKVAARNAAALIRLAEAGRLSSDPFVAASAAHLADSAIQMRIYAIIGILKLYLSAISPRFAQSTLIAVDHYQSLTPILVHFVSVSKPAYTSRIVTAL